MSEKQVYIELLASYLQGFLTPEETRRFYKLFEQDPLDPELEDLLLESYKQSIDIEIWPEDFRQRFASDLARKITGGLENKYKTLQPGYPVTEHILPNKVASSGGHRARFLRRWIWAAASFIIFATSAYLWHLSSKKEQMPSSYNNHLHADVLPGGERATLTLGDGRKIQLDSAANGQLASQGSAKVSKLANGQIVYEVKDLSSKVVMWNSISTPNGGQYQVILPDKTKVWLNASSSISFPSTFVGNRRLVKMSGEAYFEVTKNQRKPFVVDIDGKSMVQVLGTHFNINAYKEEKYIKTTLVEGRVEINSSVVLNPGQEALQTVSTNGGGAASSKLKVVDNANLSQILAWKNGVFDFTGDDLKTAMRQLERWYDIKVQYKRTKYDITFEGRMYRNLNLSDVLEGLNKMGVKFEIQGKTVIVL